MLFNVSLDSVSTCLMSSPRKLCAVKITDYFKKFFPTADKENLMSRKCKRVRREALPSSKSLKLSFIDNTHSLPQCIVIDSSPEAQPVPSPLKRTREPHAGKFPLDESRIPSWLRDPHTSSSDSSDDDLMRPVSFSNDDKLFTPSKRFKMETSLEDTPPSSVSSPIKVTGGIITPLAKELESFQFPVSPPLSAELPPIKLKDKFDNMITKFGSNETSVDDIESKRHSIMSKELDFDNEPPYRRDLELLVVSSGNLSLHLHKVRVQSIVF